LFSAAKLSASVVATLGSQFRFHGCIKVHILFLE